MSYLCSQQKSESRPHKKLCITAPFNIRGGLQYGCQGLYSQSKREVTIEDPPCRAPLSAKQISENTQTACILALGATSNNCTHKLQLKSHFPHFSSEVAPLNAIKHLSGI